jgi:hypothetical protein
MLGPEVMQFFWNELEKEASNLGAITAMGIGGLGALKGRELLDDAQRGRQMRRSQELQKLQQLNELQSQRM